MTFAPTLDKNGLSRAMRARGATLVTPQSMISTAKINGVDDTRLNRRYMNGATVNTSRDTPNVRTTALRLRAD